MMLQKILGRMNKRGRKQGFKRTQIVTGIRVTEHQAVCFVKTRLLDK